MSEKKVPPKKLTAKEKEAELKKNQEKLAKELEEETGLAAVLNVRVKETGVEHRVSREYYLNNRASVELVKDDD